MVNGCAQLPGYRRLKVLLSPVLLIMLGIVGGGLIATLQGTSSYKDRLPLLLRPGPVSPQRRHNASVVRSLIIGEGSNSTTAMSILNQELWDTGAMSTSSMRMLRRVMAKLLAGQPITVAIVGGSVSNGHGASKEGVSDYVPLFFQYIRKRFPHPGHVLHNGAIPGTRSSYMNMCLHWHVPQEIDMIVVEYALNDGYVGGDIDNPLRRSFERLIRQLLVFPKRPAVVLLMFSSAEFYDFKQTGEDQMGIMSPYYDLAWLSWRALVNERMTRNETGWSRKDIMNSDNRHPNDRGHAMLADLLIGLMEVTESSLARRALQATDEEAALTDLIEPMYKGNHPAEKNLCIMGDDFRESVKEPQGFAWKNDQAEDRAPKFSFIAENVGDSLLFTVDSTTHLTSEGSNYTGLTISFLKTYEHFGQAEVTCVSGCTCDPTTMDGIWEHRVSQLSGHQFIASPHKECVVKVTIIETTSSDGHKMKLLGVIIHEEAVRKDHEFNDLPHGIHAVGVKGMTSF